MPRFLGDDISKEKLLITLSLALEPLPPSLPASQHAGSSSSRPATARRSLTQHRPRWPILHGDSCRHHCPQSDCRLSFRVPPITPIPHPADPLGLSQSLPLTHLLVSLPSQGTSRRSCAPALAGLSLPSLHTGYLHSPHILFITVSTPHKKAATHWERAFSGLWDFMGSFYHSRWDWDSNYG